jgi:hypothetical protein
MIYIIKILSFHYNFFNSEIVKHFMDLHNVLFDMLISFATACVISAV